MSSQPLVSVIVPAYNYGHVIGQTIESVLAQTYRRLECIIVDDDSTDNTQHTVAQYVRKDERVKYLHQRNQGVAAARNNGIKNSQGVYLQLLDADDLIEPRKIELQVEYLESRSDVDIVYGSARYFRTENMEERLFSMFDEQAQSSYIPRFAARNNDALKTLVSNVMPINTPLIRRQVLEAVSGFDTAFSSVADQDFWIRCAARNVRFQYYDPDGTLALVRSHPASMSKNRRGAYAESIRLRRKIARTVTDPETLEGNRKAWSTDEGYLGIEELAAGRRIRGVYHLLRAGLINHSSRERAKWLTCAFVAPFVNEKSLRKLTVTPVRQWGRSMRSYGKVQC